MVTPTVLSSLGMFLLQVEEQCFPQKAKPTSIDLYYETLCPGCRIFIASQLYPTWEKVPQLINITLVPYGNAQVNRERHGLTDFNGHLFFHADIESI